jgi:hypothetical protein
MAGVTTVRTEETPFGKMGESGADGWTVTLVNYVPDVIAAGGYLVL